MSSESAILQGKKEQESCSSETDTHKSTCNQAVVAQTLTPIRTSMNNIWTTQKGTNTRFSHGCRGFDSFFGDMLLVRLYVPYVAEIWNQAGTEVARFGTEEDKVVPWPESEPLGPPRVTDFIPLSRLLLALALVQLFLTSDDTIPFLIIVLSNCYPSLMVRMSRREARGSVTGEFDDRQHQRAGDKIRTRRFRKSHTASDRKRNSKTDCKYQQRGKKVENCANIDIS